MSPNRLARHAALLRAAVCVAALLVVQPLQAQTLEPWQMMRSLQLLQDRIADGDQAALPMQRRLLTMTDKRLRALSREELADPRNFDAVMVYAMSGGNPATVHALMPDLVAAAEKLDAPPPPPPAEEGEDAESHAEGSGHETGEPAAEGHGEAAGEGAAHGEPVAEGGHGAEAEHGEASAGHAEPQHGGVEAKEGEAASHAGDAPAEEAHEPSDGAAAKHEPPQGHGPQGHGPQGHGDDAAGHGKAEDQAPAAAKPAHEDEPEPAKAPEHDEAHPATEAVHEAPAVHGEGTEKTAGDGHAETPNTGEKSHGGKAEDGHADGHADGHGKAPEPDRLTTGSTAPAEKPAEGGHGEKAGGHGDAAEAPPPPPGQKRRLALGVYNYGRGRLPDAKAALGPVDPMLERAEVGSYLALIKGSLLANEDAGSALKLLDTARLLGTGTLVEEAALRRSVALAAVRKDGGRFLLASGQYVRRFLRSPYASQFADAFVAGVVTLHETLDLAGVAAVTAGMTAEQERVVYLRIARRAAIDNLAALSAFASAKAGPAAGGADDPRAALYAALPDIAAPDTAETLKRLEAIDAGGLTAGDRALLEAAKAVAGETLAAPLAPAPAVPEVEKASAPRPAEPPRSIPVPESAPADVLAEGEEPLESVEDPAPAVPTEAASAEMPASAPEPLPDPAAKEPVVATPAPATPPDAADAKMIEARQALDAVDQLLKASTQ